MTYVFMNLCHFLLRNGWCVWHVVPGRDSQKVTPDLHPTSDSLVRRPKEAILQTDFPF